MPRLVFHTQTRLSSTALKCDTQPKQSNLFLWFLSQPSCSAGGVLELFAVAVLKGCKPPPPLLLQTGTGICKPPGIGSPRPIPVGASPWQQTAPHSRGVGTVHKAGDE